MAPSHRRQWVMTLASAVILLSASSSNADFDVTWLSPTTFDGKSYADGMPLGNGRVVVLGWANVSSGGVDFFVRSPLAMHTDSQLYTLAKLSVALSPNPWAVQGSYFNQTLHMEDGTLTVQGGGTGPFNYSAQVSLYVDANSDAVIVTAASGDGVTPLAITVTLETVRPAAPFNYTLDFQCNTSSSRPDVIVNDSLPAPAPAGSIALYHVNSVAGGDVSLFDASMRLQGLAPLLANFSDPLDGRIFGVGVTGGAGPDGSGKSLLRTSAGTLSSEAPAPAFAVLVAVRIDENAGGNGAGWIAGLASQLQGVPASSTRAAASASWWATFWGRSYIELPPAPPSPPQIGVFPCGGANAAMQTLSLNLSTNTVTLPGAQCFQPSSDGTTVHAGPCDAGNGWALTPCSAAGCEPWELWVQSQATFNVLGLPGAECPWLDVWTPDNPTGVYKNELWAWNSSDSTLRALCTNCPAQCVTLVPSSGHALGGVSILAAQYARTRFIQAVQSRGTSIPVKFNGMLFTTQAGSGGPADVDYRQWGPDHWWQNTRLPYGSMLKAGDFDSMRVVLDWISGYIPLASARTALLLPGQSGIFFTETVNAFGLYQGTEYGCEPSSNRPEGYPVWLEGPGNEGGWVRYDFGGNGAGPEAGLMAIDYYWHTLDVETSAKYIPIATLTLDWYMSHYPNRTADGKLLLWPTQVLESYWCEWPGWVNCCQNDMPQVAAVTSLVRNLLALPVETGLLTPQQRSAYSAFEAILPALPTTADGLQYAPAQVTSSGSHNSEVPELFAAHPFRILSVGRAATDPSVNLTIGRATWQALPLAHANTGWYYGVMDAALLGLSSEAFSMNMERAVQPPPAGYRFPAFAQHYQDYEPSADHYANLMTALQLMLLQSGEDGVAGTLVLFPAWPCNQDVSFKLWGALNTTVEVEYTNSTLVRLTVTPPARASAVKWAACVVP